MTAPPLIVSNHSDEALNAEIAFWATSANFAVKNAARAELPALCADANARAVIFELKNHDEEALDFLAKLSAGTKAKVIAVTALDQKTVSSIRRLFEAKALNIFVLERADFNTRLLADLTRPAGNGAGLDRDTLSRAIADGHVIAHYQPKVPFQPGIERYGVEALCRIQHPERGMLYPDSFIPLAEAHGLLHDLTDAVTVHAFRSLAQWDLQGLQLRLALNIAPSLLNDMTWYEKFQARCQEFQIDPGRITVEVTESSSHGGKALALEILSRLRLKGFLLSIDDFGTGFSSLETLYKLPFGELKIDKGFVFDIQKSTEARALIESTVALAKKLGLKVCAEGVESEAVFEALRELKCDDAQGYYVSKPLPAERVVPFLEEWRSKCRAQKQNPASKFANLHALLGALLTTDDEEDDHTVVLSSPAASAPGKETGTTAAAALPALVMSGNMLKALEQVQRAIAACTQAEVAGLRPKLEDLRTEIECGLAGGATAELISPDGTIKILGGNSFIIGRQASNAKADIAIPCRWLSRGEKNLRLFWRDERWLLEDLGAPMAISLGLNACCRASRWR